MNRLHILSLLGALAFPWFSSAQIDWARVERSSEQHLRPLLQGRQIFPSWIGEGEAFYYHFRTPEGKIQHTLYDGRSHTKAPLLRSAEDFVTQYRQLSGDGSLKADSLPLSGLHFTSQEGTQGFYWRYKGKSFHYDRQTGKLSLRAFSPEKTTYPKQDERITSSDGRYTIYGKNLDLYLKDETTGQMTQLTTTGSEDASFTKQASPDTVRGNARGAWWGQVFLAQIRDESGVGTMTLVNPLSKPRPKVKTFKMPLPFDQATPQSRLYRYDSRTGQGGFVEEANKFAGGVVSYQPLPEEGIVYFTRRTRTADTLELCKLEVNTGVVSTLITEVGRPHINLLLSGYRLLPGGRELLWWSERSGYGHYYRYTTTGKLLGQVTSGDSLVAGQIHAIDAKRGEMLFEGYGGGKGNPYYRKYYRVSLQGKGQRCLTPDEADHELELAPDKEHFVLKSSRMDLPPRWSAGSWKEQKFALHQLDSVPRSLLVQAGWQAPQLLQLKSADGGTNLYGVLYLPSDFDPTKKYPIITNVYPGPQADLVPRSFSLDDNGNQSLAELGCVVMNVSPRGSSPYRGRDFYNFSTGRLRDYPLADDKASVEQVARLYPAVDLDRVGIYGHSGGGFQTVAAMCTYPEFYKVGFAASGNHDNNIYINWWGEVFHGSPKIPTTMELVPQLKGKLMLAVGGMDNNVPPASTYRLAQALIQAGKAFDFFLFPEARHDLDSPYYTNLIRYYFARHLLGLQTSDVDIIQHR